MQLELACIDLWACWIGDGYCVGASDSQHASGKRYWFPASEEDEYCIDLAENVPADIAARARGDDGAMPFSDGYDLASALAPYIPKGRPHLCTGAAHEIDVSCPICGT